MALREIVTIGDEILRKRSREVTVFDEKLKSLLDDMADTMYYEHRGVGLAAVQVGVLKRVFICDVGDKHGLVEFINPEIMETNGSQIGSEGCLSVPGESGDVKRPQSLTIRAQDRNGDPFILLVDDFMAVCVCHEYDHLDGVLFIDKRERTEDSN
mgnify:CR=1 FL=1